MQTKNSATFELGLSFTSTINDGVTNQSLAEVPLVWGLYPSQDKKLNPFYSTLVKSITEACCHKKSYHKSRLERIN